MVLIGTDFGIYWASPCNGIIENNLPQNMVVYPNPSSGIFTIAYQAETQIKIYNIVGEIIYQSVAKDQFTTIDLTGQAKGIYIIKTTDRNQNIIYKKIVVQ